MLYIVGTPIGNLSDLSLRQAKTISSSAIILSEDTRSTGMLLKRIEELFGYRMDPQRKLISYYKDNEFEKLAFVLELLEQGNDIVLISQAGMPLISDPGYLLVREVIKKNLPYTVIPGPTAATTGLIHAGFPFSHFLFYGFLPKKRTDVKKALVQSMESTSGLDKCPCIYYESSARINETLLILDEIAPASDVCVCRELTKMHEESKRGRPGQLKDLSYKGEIVLIVSFHR